VLNAGTRDRGAHVEIRNRDNGTGIPADVKEKMYNPFFTAKPAGEGTGLGLSMSHDHRREAAWRHHRCRDAARRVHRVHNPIAA
jgi:C4-dicarboxylate-specific signal transduction histidine kinase